MHAFEIQALLAEQAARGHAYYEFLRVPALSAGVYALPAGAPDPQQPHGEDEIYYVVSGQAVLRAGNADRPVGPGSLVYVPAAVPHHFHTITADLTVLVVFAPAEHTRPAA